MLVADLVIELGWTRDQVLDQVDVLFLEDLAQAWTKWPSLRKFMAAYHGHKPPEKPSRNYAELFGMFPDGTIKG